jgi:hypothetical protein
MNIKTKESQKKHFVSVRKERTALTVVREWKYRDDLFDSNLRENSQGEVLYRN